MTQRSGSAGGGPATAAFVLLAALVALVGTFVLLRQSRAPRTVALPALVEEYALQLPGPGSSSNRVPLPQEASVLRQTVQALTGGRIEEASRLAPEIGYEVLPFHDEPRGLDLLILLESRRTGRGWGLLVLSPNSTSTLVVEAPHPVTDRSSEDVAARVFLDAHARALLIAGSTRNALDDGSADVAHNEGSAFEAMHEALLTPRTTVLQVHGFDAASRDASYGDVVLSSGTGSPGRQVESLAGTMEEAGIQACVYDGEHCAGLGAVTNVQGASTRAAEADFIHVELSALLRNTATVRSKVAAILSQVPLSSSSGSECPEVHVGQARVTAARPRSCRRP